MKRIVTGLFDSRSEAEAVVNHLVTHDSIDRSRIRIHGVESGSGQGSGQTGMAQAGMTQTGVSQTGVSQTGMAQTGMAQSDKGFWASLKDLFISDEDRYTYSEGIRRGGYVVSAELDDTQIDHAMDVFEQHGAVDLDAREQEWRSSGWTGYSAASTPAMGQRSADMGTGASERIDMSDRSAGTTGPAAGAAYASGATNRDRLEGEERIPIVEERLAVGKREVDRGRVRVRSYVVETPVNEQVTLRDERVTIERRAVDLPLSEADDAFRERTIEAVEHDEEAVVAKEARVREELVIRKDVEQRTETISDTVRRTEVEVEDDRTAGATTTGSTVRGTSTTNPNRR
ncbi:YsnF/AvaK domain-containing protein [Roseomonas sp. CCTCC AB2023176]|uniref:YsnF/AvaK domain-containing protein n=1 Tax=Roseomonas sp. CCTCC AB2023176 TaxID=3342640 RepID=UPI0035D598E9